MSKRKPRQKKTISLLLLSMGSILIVVFIFLFARQNGDISGTPLITVDQNKIDFGDVKLNTNLTFSIKVTNTGTGTLRFKETPYIEVLEGC
jgi:hypothetical protein